MLLSAVLLWPFQKSAEWDIDVSQVMLAGKTSYLEQLRPDADKDTPNVILIVADDLGRHDISLYGHSPLQTPNIDQLGQQGVTYREAYASAAICSTSRAGLLTGRYQNRFGFESQPMQRYVRNRLEYLAFRYVLDTDAMQPIRYPNYPSSEALAQQGLPASEITLGELFKGLGYDTAVIGKWHLGFGVDNHPLRFGFDQQYGFMEAFSMYASEADPAIVNHHHDLFWEKHIWKQKRGGPSAITRDGVPIKETRYLTDAIVDEAETFMTDAARNGRKFFAYLPFNAPHTPFQARREDYNSLAAFEDDNQRIYLAMINRLDWAVGELTQFLKREGLAENTLIIFTSDNGGADYLNATDNGPLRAGKFTQFDGGLAVPLMIYWPDTLAAREVQAPVMLTDVFATISNLTGQPLAADRKYDSINLLAPDVESVAGGRPLFWRSDHNRAIRYKNWKLLHSKKNHWLRLYDLSLEAGERTDLQHEHKAVVTQLMTMLDAWEAEQLSPRWPRVMEYQFIDEGEEFSFAI